MQTISKSTSLEKYALWRSRSSFEKIDLKIMLIQSLVGLFAYYQCDDIGLRKSLQQLISHLMGNSENYADKPQHRDFPMHKYLNQGLNQNQILQIKEAFDSYDPQNGEVEVSKLRPNIDQAPTKELMQKYLTNKKTMNFDEFFKMSREVLLAEIHKHPSMVIDTDEVGASCLFCPYLVDKKHQTYKTI